LAGQSVFGAGIPAGATISSFPTPGATAAVAVRVYGNAVANGNVGSLTGALTNYGGAGFPAGLIAGMMLQNASRWPANTRVTALTPGVLFTGNVTNGSNVITGIADTSGIVLGTTVSQASGATAILPLSCRVTAKTVNSITLSLTGNSTSAGVSLIAYDSITCDQSNNYGTTTTTDPGVTFIAQAIGGTTNGSNRITGTAFLGMFAVGMRVTGAGVGANATITAIDAAGMDVSVNSTATASVTVFATNSITLSANATATANGASFNTDNQVVMSANALATSNGATFREGLSVQVSAAASATAANAALQIPAVLWSSGSRPGLTSQGSDMLALETDTAGATWVANLGIKGYR
jgi:hypothetical protein